MPKILYVCPYAHYPGHHPHVTLVEPEILRQAGARVDVITAAGNISGGENQAVITGRLTSAILKRLRRITFLRWWLMVWETWVTLCYAVRLYDFASYDAIHLRDGEPFVFMSFLASRNTRNAKWLISLTGALATVPTTGTGIGWRIYSTAIDIIRSPKWYNLYRRVMERSRFHFVYQNADVARQYDRMFGGIFKPASIIPYCGRSSLRAADRQSSRQVLGLPASPFIALSFGVPHAGKNLAVIFQAVKQLPYVWLVHAGACDYSVGDNPLELIGRYGLADRARIHNRQIEGEKPLFFGACDVIILSYTKAFTALASMVFEAAAWGIPMIASDANELGRTVKEWGLGLTFKAEDAVSLAETIQAFQALPQEAKAQFAINARKFTEAHSAKQYGEKVMEVYREL